MTVSQGFLAPSTASNASYNALSVYISNALASFGWVQTNDTGQVVWTPSVVSITQATKSGGNGVYTYTLTSGPALRIGMAITTTGSTSAGNNVSLIAITALGAGTFTIVNAGAVTEAEPPATGTVPAETTLPGNVTRDYEIWKTNDALSSGGGAFQIFLKIFYGNSGSNPNQLWLLGTGSNGTGTLTNPTSSATSIITTTNTVNLEACHASGDSGSFRMSMFHGVDSTGANASVNSGLLINIERSISNTGAYTAAYATLWMRGGNSAFIQQTLFAAGGVTIQETNGAATIIPVTAATGEVGSTTLLCGSFPLVGGPGNPTIGMAFYRSTSTYGLGDFTDNQQIVATFYGVAHTYVTTTNGSSTMTAIAQPAGVAMRYE